MIAADRFDVYIKLIIFVKNQLKNDIKKGNVISSTQFWEELKNV